MVTKDQAVEKNYEYNLVRKSCSIHAHVKHYLNALKVRNDHEVEKNYEWNLFRKVV